MTWMMGSTAVFPLSKWIASIMCVLGLAAFDIMLHVLMNRELPRILARHQMPDADRPKQLWGLVVGVVCSWGCLGLAIYRLWTAH